MKQEFYNKILNVKNVKELPEIKIYDHFFCTIFSLNILSLLAIIPINTNGITFEDPMSIAFNFWSLIFFALMIVCSVIYLKYEYI